MNADRLLALYDRVADAPDAVARLRRFVLDLAVRGKLVEQDPADEPASELLARARCSLKKRARSASRMRWKATEVVASKEIERHVPPNWIPARVNDTALYINGLAFKPADWKQAGLPIIRIQNLTDPSKEFNFAEGDFPDEVLVRDGDLLVSWSATLEAFRWERGEGVLNQHIFRVIPDDGLTTRDFLLLLLRSAIREMAESDHAHGLVMTHINRGPFLNHVVLIPPLSEQHRIVAKVDEFMALCDRLEEARAAREDARDRLTAASIARLSAPDADDKAFRAHACFAIDALPALTDRADQITHLRQTILNLAVRGKVVEQDPADEQASEQISRIAIAKSAAKGRKGSRVKGLPVLAEIEAEQLPTGWALVRLGDLAVSLRYGTSIKCGYDRALTPVLRIPNVSSGQISVEDLKFGSLDERDRKALALMAGDLLMIRSNGSLGIVGRSAVVTPNAEGMSFAGYLIRLRTLNEQLNTRYVWLALNSYAVREQIERPIRSAVGLKNVNLTEFSNLSFWLPPLAEQHRIVAKVDGLLALCDRLETSLGTADISRNRLLESLILDALLPKGGRTQSHGCSASRSAGEVPYSLSNRSISHR